MCLYGTPRFVGHFEFLSINSNGQSGQVSDLRVFETMTSVLDPISEGRRVLLKCFTRGGVYMQEVKVVCVDDCVDSSETFIVF
jgi:hypothetical protein